MKLGLSLLGILLSSLQTFLKPLDLMLKCLQVALQAFILRL